MFEHASTPEIAFGAAVRQQLHRRELAAERYRAAVAHALHVAERDMRAFAHLAQRGELSTSQLGSLLNLSSAGVTSMVQRLEARGHVDRIRHPHDGRSTLLRLSAKLVDRAEVAYRPLVTELERIAEEVPIQDRAAVERFLSRVAAASEEHADQALRELGTRKQGASSLPLPGLWA